MNRFNQILLFAIALQALLALLTWTFLHRTPGTTERTGLLRFAETDIQSIEIMAIQGDQKQDPIVLARNQTNKWVLSSSEDYPTRQEPMEKLIELLLGIRISDPIAGTESAHIKLSVAEDAYDRKITIREKEKTHTLYIGRGGRSAAAIRMEGSNDVYEAPGLSVWDINSRATAYIDPAYVQTEEADLNEVTVTNASGTMRFIRHAGNWIPAEIPETEKVPDTAEIQRFIRNLAKITIAEPVGRTSIPEYGLESPATVTLSGTREDTAFSVRYDIGSKIDTHRYVKAADNDFIVRISSFSLDPAVEKTISDFLKEPTPDSASSEPHAEGNGEIPPEILQQLRMQGIEMP